MIVITDGYPQYHRNGISYSQTSLIKMGKKAMRRALRKQPNILSVLVSGYSGTEDINRQIFGSKRMMTVEDMKQGASRITKEFRKHIIEVLR